MLRIKNTALLTGFFWISMTGLSVFFTAFAETTDEKSIIVFLHTNDLHFDFNHRETFARIVEHYRDNYDNVFLLDGGDFFVRHQHRWPIDDLDFYRQRSRFIIDIMNEMGYDVAVLGNHELDYKNEITRDSLRLARFPLLGANVEVSTDKYDQPEPYTVFETVEGHTIAVLGLSIGGAAGVRTTDRVQTVKDHLHLRDEHNVLVLLTHIGYRNDQALARQFSELDLIVGGHSHTQLNPAEMVNGVLIAQTGGNPHVIDEDRRQYLGVVRLLLEDGQVVGKSGEVLTIEADDEIERTLGRPVDLEIKVGSLGQIVVSIENNLVSNELEIEAELKVEGGDKVEVCQGKIILQPGELLPVQFDLPFEMIDGKYEIDLVVAFNKPGDLPAWEQRIDFSSQEYSKLFDLDNYTKLNKVDSEGFPGRDPETWAGNPYFVIGEDDFKAKIYSAWDDEFFYLAAAVTDDLHFNNSRDDRIWDGDSLQFAIARRGVGAEAFNLDLALASDQVRTYQWEGPDTGIWGKSDYSVVRDEERGKTFYEVKIPFAQLNFEEPGKGVVFGFNAVVFNDDDGEGYEQWIEITHGIAGGWNPDAFKRLVLWD